jgi:two-component system, LuxR family, sensor kinase FixL
MTLSRHSTFLLLTGLITGSILLTAASILVPARYTTGLLLAGLLLMIVTLFFLVYHHFTRGKAEEDHRLLLEQRLSFLVQHIKDYAIFLIDPEGRVMSWNKGAEQIKGYTEAEIIGKPISVFYTEADNQSGEPFQNLQKALEEGRYESVGLRKRKDGSVFYADVVFTPFYDADDTLKGFIKITRDITDQKKSEENMLSALTREKELNELKSRFVTLASHEFKTPLSVILSSVSLIEKYPDTDMQDKRVKHIHRIKSNVNNLKQILNDFLSLEKLEVGIVHNSPDEANLQNLVEDSIRDMADACKENQQILLSTIGPPGPVQIDTHLLRNVLSNLLSNAIKYSPECSSIDCTIEYGPDEVGIHIKDQGIGIPPEEQRQLFQRFFRATNTSGISGTGLGLSIVKKYLDLMGGSIHMTSTFDMGSTFTVSFPYSPPDHSHPPD